MGGGFSRKNFIHEIFNQNLSDSIYWINSIIIVVAFNFKDSCWQLCYATFIRKHVDLQKLCQESILCEYLINEYFRFRWISYGFELLNRRSIDHSPSMTYSLIKILLMWILDLKICMRVRTWGHLVLFFITNLIIILLMKL